MPYNALVDRVGSGGEFPEALAHDVIGDIRTTSTVLKLGHVIPTSTRDSRIPVLSADVQAYFVTGDSGLKGVSAPAWSMPSVYAEEIAVIVPIPDSVLADSSFSLWDAVRPLVARAFARKIDNAVIFGVDKPTTWSPSLLDLATTASQTVESTEDPAADLLRAAEMVANEELRPTAAAVRNGFQYNAAVTRTQAFQANPLTESNPFPLSIAGLSVSTDPVLWDHTRAEAVVAAWDAVVLGIRQDLTFTMSDSGVIVDETGNVVMSAFQRDTTLMRCVLRCGVLVKRPVIGGTTPTNPIAAVVPA